MSRQTGLLAEWRLRVAEAPSLPADPNALVDEYALAKHRGVENVPWKMGSLHDLRKSFVNASARILKPDALLAVAGHSDKRTTLGYMTRTEQDSAQVRAAGKLSRTA